MDVAAGTMGPINASPVTPSSLFQLFEAGAPLLSTLLLLLLSHEAALDLTTPLASLWPAYADGCLTLGELLSHSSGLQGLLPSFARLSDLLDPLAMSEWLARKAKPSSHPSPSSHTPFSSAPPSSASPSSHVEAEYEGAPWGWALTGLLRSLAQPSEEGWSLQMELERTLTKPLALSEELRLCLTDEMCEQRSSRHSMAAMMR